MKTLLHIDSSANTKASVSRALCAGFASGWLKADPGNKVVYRDLNADAVPVVTSVLLEAIYSPVGKELDAKQRAALDVSNTVVNSANHGDQERRLLEAQAALGETAERWLAEFDAAHGHGESTAKGLAA